MWRYQWQVMNLSTNEVKLKEGELRFKTSPSVDRYEINVYVASLCGEGSYPPCYVFLDIHFLPGQYNQILCIVWSHHFVYKLYIYWLLMYSLSYVIGCNCLVSGIKILSLLSPATWMCFLDLHVLLSCSCYTGHALCCVVILTYYVFYGRVPTWSIIVTCNISLNSKWNITRHVLRWWAKSQKRTSLDKLNKFGKTYSRG